MNGIEFRRAVEGDAGMILSVMAQAFERAPETDKYERDKERIAKDIDAHRVLLRDGKSSGRCIFGKRRFRWATRS